MESENDDCNRSRSMHWMNWTRMFWAVNGSSCKALCARALGRATDDDLMQIAGKARPLFGYLAGTLWFYSAGSERRLNDFLQTYGEKKKALIEQKSWLSRNKGWLVAAALLTSILGIVAYYFRLVKSYDS
ncbi:MAG: CsbD family protein [Ardenticatenaceae bacterium]|nr:CsbD family protein [Ardenticatenaceae bacterium]